MEFREPAPYLSWKRLPRAKERTLSSAVRLLQLDQNVARCRIVNDLRQANCGCGTDREHK